MQLQHSFSVPAGVDEVWRVLRDVERMVPCLPGAALDSVDGHEFTGSFRAKVGPISLTYKGKARIVDTNERAHRTVVEARGRDARGNGSAAAKVTARLVRQGSSTRVDLLTDLSITGKPAQFGRGVMVDVGNRLIAEFADCLAGQLSAGQLSAGQLSAGTVMAGSSGGSLIARGPADPGFAPGDAVASGASAASGRSVDRGAEAGNMVRGLDHRVAKRLAPVAVGLILVAVGVVILRRRR
jgi:uncharacterized protein